MQFLQAVSQHGTVPLEQDVGPDLDDMIGTDPHDVHVERGVVDLAERQAVLHHRLPAFVSIGDDVGRVDQAFESLVATEPTHGATPAIRLEDSLAELRLVQARHGEAGRIGPPCLVGHSRLDSRAERVDVLLSPTSPTTAFDIGAIHDPLTMYLNDICTIPTNLAGDCAMSVPFGTGADGLPVGVQVLGPALGEVAMFRAAAALEAAAPAAGGAS